MNSVTLHHGDCLDVLATLPDASVDAVVTDPPYGLEFMGKEWDRFSGDVTDRDFKGFVLSQQRTRNVKCPECSKWAYDKPGRLCECGGIRRAQGNAFQQWCELWTTECLRVLKPGGHLLAFGGSRTWHRLAAAVEDAGFEIRDSIAWLYGSGFPKSLDVSKAIDKAAGAEREVVGTYAVTRDMARNGRVGDEAISPVAVVGATLDITAPATPAAEQWQGWGTALKPAFEPVVVARKPLVGTVAANVLQHGTGALNIDACRIGTESTTRTKRGGRNDFPHEDDSWTPRDVQVGSDAGRWPANVVLDESQAAVLDQQSGILTGQAECTPARGVDQGGASRFFYVAKAPKSERPRTDDGTAHPTVKPLALMRWLVRLVTPPGGVVLEPFAGSGTTVEACLLEGFQCIAIEREADYLPLIEARINRVAAMPAPDLGLLAFLDEDAS